MTTVQVPKESRFTERVLPLVHGLEKLTINMNSGALNTFDNVTAESLVILAGVIDGEKIAPEGLEYRILQAQVLSVQFGALQERLTQRC